MRISVLMSIGSPWSRQIALRLCELGHSVQAIDLAVDAPGAYLNATDDYQQESIQSLRKTVCQVDILRTRTTSSFRYFSCARQLRSVCRKFKTDLLLSLYGGGLATLSFVSGVRPYAVYAVGSDILCSSRLRRIVLRKILTTAGVVFANGDYLAQKTQELVPTARVHPLVMGIDLQRFVPGSPASSPVKVLCTRGFSAVYNNELLIRSLGQLPPETPEMRVVFTSGGPDLASARTLANKVVPAPAREQVEFLGGVTDEEMKNHLQSSSVFVSVSHSDGTSISLLEAMACGLFPILSDIPQNRAWVRPELGNGFLVSPDDPTALAAALAQATSDRELRERARHINRQIISERADGRKNISELAATLESLVSVRSLGRLQPC